MKKNLKKFIYDILIKGIYILRVTKLYVQKNYYFFGHIK